MNKLLLFLSITFVFTACKKETGYLTGENRIIFGSIGSECIGNCSTLYKLSSQQLLPDDCNYCPPTNIPFQSTPLPMDKFDLAVPLLEDIPAGLFDIQEKVYACPGCDDGITYFLEITRDGQTHQFRWDGYFRDVPQAFKPYFERVVATIKAL